jgi:hypothetical protein
MAAFGSIALVMASFRSGPVRATDWYGGRMFLGLALLSALLWLFNNDRYALVYIPVASAFLLVRAEPLRLLPAASGIACYAVLSVVATVDHRAYNEALWSIITRLRAEGVPVSEIDGGYTVNAWLQYVRPEQAHREPDGCITIPFFNDMLAVTYTISNSPLSGSKIVNSVPYSGWISSGHLYLLEPPSPEGEGFPRRIG